MRIRHESQTSRKVLTHIHVDQSDSRRSGETSQNSVLEYTVVDDQINMCES